MKLPSNLQLQKGNFQAVEEGRPLLWMWGGCLEVRIAEQKGEFLVSESKILNVHGYLWSCHRICNHKREVSKLLRKIEHFCRCGADVWKFGSRNRRDGFGLRIKNSEDVRKLTITYEAAIESAIPRGKFTSCWGRSTTFVDVGQMFGSSDLGTEGEF